MPDIKEELQKAVADGAEAAKGEEQKISSGLEKAVQEAKGTSGHDLAEAKQGLEKLAAQAEQMAATEAAKGWRWIRAVAHFAMMLVEKGLAWLGQRLVVIGFAIINSSLKLYASMTRVYPEVHLIDMAQRARFVSQLADDAAKAEELRKG